MSKNPIYNDLKLTPKQERFCQEFIKCLEMKTAYLNAGYSLNSGSAGAASKLYNSPKIQARLRQLHEESSKFEIASLDEIKATLTRILRQTAEEEVLMTEFVEKGVSQTVKHKKKADLRTAAKAAELLGKMAGAFSDGTQNVIGVQVVLKDDLEE